MAVLDLDHCNLRARRELLDELKAFYCAVVGLREGPRPGFVSFGYWLYAGDRAVLHLSEARSSETRVRADTTFDHVAFRCDNRDEFETRLQAHAIDFKVREVPQLGQIQLVLRDPAGNGVELNFTERPPRP